MPLTPITKEIFGQKRFKRNLTYHFASRDVIAPLALQELSTAMLHAPIAFAKVQDHLMPVMILGLGGEKNLFVAPDGRWIGRYIPICYRFQPFVLASVQGGQHVLCCDDDSDLISDIEGEPFFDEAENPSKVVTDIMNFLGQHQSNRSATRDLCGVLEKHGLISAWPIKLKNQDTSKEIMLSGLYRVDEQVFSQLDSTTLGMVHQAGALPLIYCQLLSMQHLSMLGDLSTAHVEVQRRMQAADQPEADSEITFSTDDTTISFESL